MTTAIPAAPTVRSTPGTPEELERLREEVASLEERVQASEQHRRAMLHLMGDLAESNRRLNDQRRAMLHILVDYEKDRKDLAWQSERLNNSRRALMHILADAHHSNQRLGLSRKAMIHIMGDLRETTEEMRLREQELRDKQEQLVQAAKLATLGELTTGVAHELNNPLNNIGLYLGNVLDFLSMGPVEKDRIEYNLNRAMQQVHKATEIITHLRTFGRAAPSSRELVHLNDVVESGVSLLRQQLHLRQIELDLQLSDDDPCVLGNSIQLEQVLMNLLTNARDALAESDDKVISITTSIQGRNALLVVEDSGPGIPPELEQRIFDPFFTTKDVGEGTGLGLSIVYGIVKDHEGSISLQNDAETTGARFVIELPLGDPQ